MKLKRTPSSGALLAPIGLVAHQIDKSALSPARKPKWPGADGRHGVRRRRLRRDDHGVAPTQIEQQRPRRPREIDAHRQGIEHDNIRNRLEQLPLRVERIRRAGAVERKFYGARIAHGAVVKPHIRRQVKEISAPRRRDLPRQRQVRLHGAMRIDPRQALEHIGVDDLIGRRRRAGGRVKVRRLKRYADPQPVGARLWRRATGKQRRSAKSQLPTRPQQGHRYSGLSNSA